MQINLQEILPDHIPKENMAASEVWAKNVTITKGEHRIVVRWHSSYFEGVLLMSLGHTITGHRVQQDQACPSVVAFIDV